MRPLWVDIADVTGQPGIGNPGDRVRIHAPAIRPSDVARRIVTQDRREILLDNGSGTTMVEPGKLRVELITTQGRTSSFDVVVPEGDYDIDLIELVNPEWRVASPSEALDLGTDPGQNHFHLQWVKPGAGRYQETLLTEIESGFRARPWFYTVNDSSVMMSAPARGHTTPGSSYTRCELREVNEAGERMAFDPHTGTHRISGVTTIHQVPENSELTIAQLHNGSTDRVDIRTQMVSGQVAFRIRVNGESAEVINGIGGPFDPVDRNLVVGSPIPWKIQVVAGHLEVHMLNRKVIDLSNPFTPTAGVSTWYFKCGAYNGDPAATASKTSLGRIELTNLDHWHTGWTP